MLRPKGALMAGSGASVLAVGLGVEVMTDVNIGAGLWRLTVAMCLISVVFGLWRLSLCLLRQPRAKPTNQPLDWPTYTIIIPLFREAHMVPHLVEAMSKLDYPKDRLDIIFACEALDIETSANARAYSTAPFRTLIVPPVLPGGEPQTKPRALNYALARSRGELVTIYDAEDRPDPGQLKAAACAFSAKPDWVALQAPLDYFNLSDGWLARQFALEYASLFHVLIPAFNRLNLPFPLGGTSNHIRRSALETVGGWDPYNVTEDADLAFRLVAREGHIGWIKPPTQEEACHRLGPWFRQRSRWIKGYIQTWQVHMQTPFAGGWRRAVMLQVTLGLSLLSIAFYAPVMMGLLLWTLAYALGVVSEGVDPIYLYALGFSLACGMVVGALGAARMKRRRLWLSVIGMPIYWLLLFPPFIWALWELRTRPYYWHKTEHGVTGARPQTTDVTEPTQWTPKPTSS